MTAPDKDRKPTQAELLVGLARDVYDFGVSTSGDAFAIPLDGPRIARRFRGGQSELRSRLAAMFLDDHGKPPSAAALADALTALEGIALRGDREELSLRLARDGDAVLIDLGREDGTAVRVEPGGWRVTGNYRPLFYRSALTSELATPEAGGDVTELADLINVTAEDFDLLVAFLVGSFLPGIPHPIGLLTGEQGTGKTTLARFLAQLVDPSPAPVRTAPRDVEAWAVTAAGSWLVALDNLSHVPQWLSDALCRAATGDGLVRRRLYADADLSVLTFRRVVLLTAIDPGALSGDLGERLVTFELERIRPWQRRTDDELAVRFAAAHPRLLGALLDLLAQVLEVLPTVTLDRLPRMADFARVVAAVDQVRGTDALARYTGQADRIAEDVVESDPFAALLRDLVATRGTVEGSASEVRDLAAERLTSDRHPKWFPSTPRAAAAKIKRSAPALRQVGVTVDYERTAGARTWTLTHEEAPEQPSQPSRPSQPASSTPQEPVPGVTVREPQPSQPSPPTVTGSSRPSLLDRQLDPPSDANDGCDGRSVPLTSACHDCGRPAIATDHDGTERCGRHVSWAEDGAA